eukprot:gene4179-20365_t
MELVVKREEKNLGQYVLNSREQLLRGVCFEGTIRTDSTMPNKEFKKKVANDLENNWMGKNMYSQFVREMPENVDKKKTWQCLSKSDLQVQTKALLCAAQEQAIRTNYVKHHIDKSVPWSSSMVPVFIQLVLGGPDKNGLTKRIELY